jgi:hypothetical protein
MTKAKSKGNLRAIKKKNKKVLTKMKQGRLKVMT